MSDLLTSLTSQLSSLEALTSNSKKRSDAFLKNYRSSIPKRPVQHLSELTPIESPSIDTPVKSNSNVPVSSSTPSFSPLTSTSFFKSQPPASPSFHDYGSTQLSDVSPEPMPEPSPQPVPSAIQSHSMFSSQDLSTLTPPPSFFLE
ncbi:hypothetical protein GEMRC1_008790 [Eukaryota sp. GEM-RC1]